MSDATRKIARFQIVHELRLSANLIESSTNEEMIEKEIVTVKNYAEKVLRRGFYLEQ